MIKDINQIDFNHLISEVVNKKSNVYFLTNITNYFGMPACPNDIVSFDTWDITSQEHDFLKTIMGMLNDFGYRSWAYDMLRFRQYKLKP